MQEHIIGKFNYRICSTHTHSGFITSLSPTVSFLLLADLYFVIQWPRHPWRIIKWLRALLLLIMANLKIISNSIRLTCVIYYAVLFPIKNSGWIRDWCRGASMHACVHAGSLLTDGMCDFRQSTISLVEEIAFIVVVSLHHWHIMKPQGWALYGRKFVSPDLEI